MNRSKLRQHRERRTRKKISGAQGRFRLSVFRSNKVIYAQLIDDESGKTIVQADSRKIGKNFSVESAKKVGKEIAKKGLKLKCFSVVFDRGGYKYHGKVQALAQAAREEGLKF